MKNFDPTLDQGEQFWCAFCERVSPSEYGCPYSDCEVSRTHPEYRELFEKRLIAALGEDYREKIKQGFGMGMSMGGGWSGLREAYHPEFPSIAKPDVCYPMPELPAHIWAAPSA